MAFGGQLRRGNSASILEHFAALGGELYAGDRHPAAPSAAATLALLGAGNPTRRRCQLMAFLADGPTARGRVAAMINPQLCDQDGRPFGLLGFFECQDHEDTARRLIDLALEWLDREGCRVVRGPINFTTFHNYRLVTASHRTGYIPGEPYHPDFYPRLWRAAEFTPVARYSSNHTPFEILAQFESAAEFSRAAGYTVRHFAGANDLPALYELTLATFAKAWMFSPITREEFDALYSPERVEMVAPYSILAEAPDGQPVGFLYGYPVELDGQPILICKTIAVHPEHRKYAVYQQLSYRYYQLARDGGREIVAALMHREGTPNQMGWMTADTCVREYEVYERRL